MDWKQFTQWGNHVAQWATKYHLNLRDRPVRAQTQLGDIAAQIAPSPPEQPVEMETIMADFEKIVMPGMTHWQHPRFFAYFPANTTPPSVLAEMLVATMGAQCMLWQTSPAATEMESVMLDWLRQAIDLPEQFQGVIQDSASSATLAAVLIMREKTLAWVSNTEGLRPHPQLRIYSSDQVHSSIDRAVWISGIGLDNLVRIPTQGAMRGMDAEALEAAIQADKAAGYLPAGVIACIGGTSTGACDDLEAILDIAKAHGLYSHVDAAWAGSGMIVPAFRALWKGVEKADSLVFNPHKWLGAQFDCSAHFVTDPDSLIKTLAMRPEYLKTHGKGQVINYSEWSVQLGRRFRALKLWFLIRAYGLEGLRARITNHVQWAELMAEKLRVTDGFEIVTAPILSLFTFRLAGRSDDTQLALVNRINDDGRIYLTQTIVNGQMVIRFQVGQFETTMEDIDLAYETITELAKEF